LPVGQTLADRIAAGEADVWEWDPECQELDEDSPDDIDPGLFAELKREPAGCPPGPPDADPGLALVSAAWDAARGDDPSLLADADLIGQARALRALSARALGRQYWLVEEFLRRRPAGKKDRRVEAQDERRDLEEGIAADVPARPRLPVAVSAEAQGELALGLTLTGYGAETLMMIAADLALRLPIAAVEFRAGRIDEARVKILWEYTRDLPNDCAMALDRALSPVAHAMTTGELREQARAAQIRIDPAAAERRRKRGEKHAKVSLYANDDLTGTLAFEHVPAVQAAAAKSRVAALARAMKSAGADDDLSLLQAKAGLGLLIGTLPLIPPPEPPNDAPGPDSDPGPGGGFGPGGGSGSPGSPDAEDGQTAPWPSVPESAAAAAPGCTPIPSAYRSSDPGRLRLLAPWRTLTGMAGEPGELSAFGVITPAQARDLAQAAANDPACTWRILLTDDDGRAIALTALTRPEGAPGRIPGLIEEVTVTIQASLAAGLSSDGEWRDVARQLAAVADPALSVTLRAIVAAADKAAAEAEIQAVLDAEAGGCAHAMEGSGYRIPPRLRRWIQARDATCRNPVCRRRARQCDLDHTLAHHKGGRTCSCGLGPLCRTCHQLKQSPGWHLKQEPGGVFVWTTPAGLTYRKEPHRYLV
jgi:hypothetical protein